MSIKFMLATLLLLILSGSAMAETIGGTSSSATPSTFVTRDGTGGVTGTTASVTTNSSGAPAANTIYKDNLINAWGNIPAAGTAPSASFGLVGTYTHATAGVYVLTLNNPLPTTTSGCVTVTLQGQGLVTAVITTTSTITVTTTDTTGATPKDIAFFVMIIQGK